LFCWICRLERTDSLNFWQLTRWGKVQQLSMRISSWRSGAILLYLAQKYDNMPTSLEQQAEISQWVLFANATLGREFCRSEPSEAPLVESLNQILGGNFFY